NPDGTLSIGYGYAQLEMAEQYNAPGSPYWALKSFLPLALPEAHPFWQAKPAPLPALEAVKSLPHAGMLVCPDPGSPHRFALSAAPSAPWARHGEAKYGRMAYSTHFAFSVPAGRGLAQLAADNTLALSRDGRRYHVRAESLDVRFEHGGLRALWRPWPGVEV